MPDSYLLKVFLPHAYLALRMEVIPLEFQHLQNGKRYGGCRTCCMELPVTLGSLTRPKSSLLLLGSFLVPSYLWNGSYRQ